MCGDKMTVSDKKQVPLKMEKVKRNDGHEIRKCKTRKWSNDDDVQWQDDSWLMEMSDMSWERKRKNGSNDNDEVMTMMMGGDRMTGGRSNEKDGVMCGDRMTASWWKRAHGHSLGQGWRRAHCRLQWWKINDERRKLRLAHDEGISGWDRWGYEGVNENKYSELLVGDCHARRWHH